MIILGLDPGTVATGFGIVAFENGHLRLESCGVWRPAARLTLPEKLDFLFTAAAELLGRVAPAAVSVETVFAARNISSALKLSHARGVLLAAAMLPPCLEKMWRISGRVRFLLSVTVSTITATPPGPYPS